jgi:SdpC family antimicrobial peptide
MQSKLTVAAMALLGITSLGAGCGGAQEEASTSPSAAEARPQVLSGRELYKGLFFGVGPAARHFQEIWQRPEFQALLAKPEMRQQLELAAERLSARIEAEDPAFFDRLARDLRSRDHLTINRLFTAAQEKTQAAVTAIRKEEGLAQEVGASAIAVEEPGLILYVPVVTDVVVQYYEIIYYVLMPLSGGPEAAGLLRDAWVDIVANTSFDAQ